MSKHRLAVVPAALAAVALAAPAAAHADTTLTFKEVDKGSSFHFIDNAPKGGRHHSVSAGDQFVIQTPLAGAAGAHIGTLNATCTYTKGAKNPDKGGAVVCYGVFSFKNGTLDALVAMTNPNAKATTGGIVGGTGVYAGARGAFVSKDTKTGSDDTVTLMG